MILVIGQSRTVNGEAQPALRQPGYRLAGLGELDAALLRALAPEMVVSALMGDGFDALDVARRLAQLEYPGPYRVLTPPLPAPDLVRAEIRAASPGLDFDLLIVSHGPDRPA